MDGSCIFIFTLEHESVWSENLFIIFKAELTMCDFTEYKCNIAHCKISVNANATDTSANTVTILRELIIPELISADQRSQKGKFCGIYFCRFKVWKNFSWIYFWGWEITRNIKCFLSLSFLFQHKINRNMLENIILGIQLYDEKYHRKFNHFLRNRERRQMISSITIYSSACYSGHLQTV